MPSAITCPATCATQLALPVGQSECTPVFLPGGIRRLFITEIGNTFDAPGTATTGIDDAAAWTTKMDQAGGSGKIITFHIVSGGVAESEDTTYEASLGRLSVLNRKHTATFKIDEVDDTTDLSLQQMQKCGGQWLTWFETTGGTIFGGPECVECGIAMTFTFNRIIPEDDSDVIHWQATGVLEDLSTFAMVTAAVPATPEPV